LLADVFARSFLDGADTLEGLVVESKDILDDSNAAKEQCDRVKLKLKDMLSSEVPGTPDIIDGRSRKLNMAQPAAITHEIINLMGQLKQIMRNNFATMDIESIQRRWCCHESPALFRERWERHFADFCSTDGDDVESSTSVSESDNDKPKTDIFAPSKIPELYDTLKYDALHNRAFMTTIFVDQEAPVTRSSDVSDYSRASTESGIWKVSDGLHNLKRLYHCVRILFNYIAPQEFGINDKEKREIGMLISLPLMKKIIKDLEEIRAQDEPRTRLYFTKGGFHESVIW
jgi:inositol hexakisphosphate/diphosphoinositol-pentakisphosphate kinase